MIEKVEDISLYQKPWIMVDRIVSYKKSEMIITQKNISYSDFFILGHFEDQSVFPGVLLVESIRQSFEILLSLSNELSTNLVVRHVSTRFLSRVLPGDVIMFYIKCSNSDDGVVVSAEGKKDDDLMVVCSKLEYEVCIG